VDGQEPAEGALQLAAQLTDLHLAPAPALAPPMNRFAEELEVRVETELAFPGGEIGAIRGAERHRGSVDFERASWREHDAALAWLVGRRFGAGITAELLQRLGDRPDDGPVRRGDVRRVGGGGAGRAVADRPRRPSRLLLHVAA